MAHADGPLREIASVSSAHGADDDLATAAQKKFLRSLITQHGLKADVMDTLLRGVEFTRGEGEKVNDAINRLTRGQCSTLIETIKDGPEHGPYPPGEDPFHHEDGEER
jgi:hypothetical protein